MKLSSYIRWRGAWRNPCIHLIVWLRRSNDMVDLSKNNPGKKMKTHPSGQTRNRVWINPSRYGKELKAIL